MYNTDPNTDEISELSVSINIHLYNTIVDSGADFLLGGARSTVEDEVAS